MDKFSERTFIEQANQYGSKKTGFFFLIDFEKQKPFIARLHDCAQQGVYYNILGHTNLDWQVLPPDEAVNIAIDPISFECYQSGFNKVQQEIKHGNSYLLNLTYPSKIKSHYSLRQIFQYASAKYKFLIDNQCVCFSPECFVNIIANKIYSYPMKGTINADLDNAEQKLINSLKEQSEHNTIVDLIRNDLSIVATNIQVNRYRFIEIVQTQDNAILQTSSEISGDVKKNWQNSIGDMMMKLLPAGSISGAPKHKTIQIIKQAEIGNRGYYSGVFGIFDGENLHSAVAIRYVEQQGNTMFFRSGGGITAESQLIDEYHELLNKIYVPII